MMSNRVSYESVYESEVHSDVNAKAPLFGKNDCCKAVLNRYNSGGWGAPYIHEIEDEAYYICGEEGLKSFAYQRLCDSQYSLSYAQNLMCDKYESLLNANDAKASAKSDGELAYTTKDGALAIDGTSWTLSDATNGFNKWRFEPLDASESEVKAVADNEKVFSKDDVEAIKSFDEAMKHFQAEKGKAFENDNDNVKQKEDFTMPARKPVEKVNAETESTATASEDTKVSYGAAVITTPDYIENEFVIKKFTTESARDKWAESLQKQAEADDGCAVRHMEASDLKEISEFLKTPVNDYGTEEPLAKAADMPATLVNISEKEASAGGLDWLKESGINMKHEIEKPDGLKHYEGLAGKFDYNPKDFKIEQREIYGGEFDGATIDSLKYIGKERDINKVDFPKGTVDAERLEFTTPMKGFKQQHATTYNNPDFKGPGSGDAPYYTDITISKSQVPKDFKVGENKDAGDTKVFLNIGSDRKKSMIYVNPSDIENSEKGSGYVVTLKKSSYDVYNLEDRTKSRMSAESLADKYLEANTAYLQSIVNKSSNIGKFSGDELSANAKQEQLGE